jgi:hypothetical protein
VAALFDRAMLNPRRTAAVVAAVRRGSSGGGRDGAQDDLVDRSWVGNHDVVR